MRGNKPALTPEQQKRIGSTPMSPEARQVALEAYRRHNTEAQRWYRLLRRDKKLRATLEGQRLGEDSFKEER